jgi:hypothetical protein
MADTTPTPAPANQAPPTVANTQPNPTGGEPGPKPGNSAFDPGTLSDDDFNKLYSDERLYKHPRFKSLSEKAKQADKLQKEQEDNERKVLEEQGKHKELAEKLQAENSKLLQRINTQALNTAIQIEAAKLGIVDPEAAQALIDKELAKVDESGNVVGVKEALEKLVESKPYLKGAAPTQPVGTPSNPNPSQTENGTKRYKLSQIQDSKFFKANEKDIMEAVSKGLVDDDVHFSAPPAPQAT